MTAREQAHAAAVWAVIRRHLDLTDADPLAASLSTDEVVRVAVDAALDSAGVR